MIVTTSVITQLVALVVLSGWGDVPALLRQTQRKQAAIIAISLSTATAPPMVAVFTSRAVHTPVCNTLRLNVTKLIVMAVDSIRKDAHVLICVVANLNATALNTVVVFMLQAPVAVAFAVWISVVIALIAV